MKLLSLSLLAIVAVAKYNNASIPFDHDLSCTSCIRGGYNFCDYYHEGAPGKIEKETWNCTNQHMNPETSITKPGVWNETGYFCSNWFSSKVNAIINQCAPQVNRNIECGEYLVNVADGGNPREIQWNINKLEMNQTCTYRVFSTCGYPGMYFNIMNDSHIETFDIVYSVLDNTPLDWDLNNWEQILHTNHSESFRTNATLNKVNLTEGWTREFIDKPTFDSCTGTPRSMWVTISKVSDGVNPGKPSNGTKLP